MEVMLNSAPSRSSRRNARRRAAKQKALNNARLLVKVQPSKPNRSSRRRRNRQKSLGKTNGSSARNLYLRSLLEPELNLGAKVPDIDVFPSATFQTTFDSYLGTGAGGDSVFLQCTPIIGDPNVNSYPIQSANGTSIGSIAAVNSASWAQRNAIISLYRMFRPVSACIRATFIGPSQNDGGQFLAGLMPRGIAYPNNISGLLTLPQTLIIPVREGVCVRWRPQDNADLEYNGNIPTQNPPSIFVAATGLPAGVTYVYLRVTVNWEATANTEQLNMVSATSSPSNPGLLTQALDAVSNSPYAWSLAHRVTNFAVDSAARYATSRLMPGARLQTIEY